VAYSPVYHPTADDLAFLGQWARQSAAKAKASASPRRSVPARFTDLNAEAADLAALDMETDQYSVL
jgi:hypothetical protein